jgi:ABC-type polysaccharide/polyol phosphate export permease
MFAYFGAVWRCRYFWLSLVRMDLRTRYRGSVLGMGWSLLHPIAMTAIICSVFSILFHQELRHFAPYVMSGLAFWAFIQAVAVQGCQCFFQGQAYIRQFPAPMAIYPLRTVLGSGFHFLLALLLVVVLAAVLGGLTAPLALLHLLPALLLLVVLGWSLALLCGLATVRFRDTQHLAEIGLQGLFYLTPIMYPIQILKDQHFDHLLYLNPFWPFLQLLRAPVLDGCAAEPAAWIGAVAVTVAAAVAAVVGMWQQERKLIFHL